MSSNHYHILWADDDADDLFIVREVMESYDGYHVVEMSNGRQVLDYLDTIKSSALLPTLIILDINMPVINGKDVLRKLRDHEHFETIPVVLFTTSSLPQDEQFARKYNAGFVTKPLDVSQMEKITDLFIDNCSDEIKKNIRRHLQ